MEAEAEAVAEAAAAARDVTEGADGAVGAVAATADRHAVDCNGSSSDDGERSPFMATVWSRLWTLCGRLRPLCGYFFFFADSVSVDGEWLPLCGADPTRDCDRDCERKRRRKEAFSEDSASKSSDMHTAKKKTTNKNSKPTNTFFFFAHCIYCDDAVVINTTQ